MNLCTYLRTSILRCGLLCWSCHKRGLLGLEIWCPFKNYVWRLPPDYLSYMLYSCYLSYMLWSINLRNMDHLAHHSQMIYDDAPLKDCDFFIVTLNNQEVSTKMTIPLVILGAGRFRNSRVSFDTTSLMSERVDAEISKRSFRERGSRSPVGNSET